MQAYVVMVEEGEREKRRRWIHDIYLAQHRAEEECARLNSASDERLGVIVTEHQHHIEQVSGKKYPVPFEELTKSFRHMVPFYTVEEHPVRI